MVRHKGQDYPDGNPNDGPDGRFPAIMAVIVAITTLVLLAACPAPQQDCESGRQRWNESSSVWQLCQDGKWVNTPNTNPDWTPGTDI